MVAGSFLLLLLVAVVFKMASPLKTIKKKVAPKPKPPKYLTRELAKRLKTPYVPKRKLTKKQCEDLDLPYGRKPDIRYKKNAPAGRPFEASRSYLCAVDGCPYHLHATNDNRPRAAGWEMPGRGGRYNDKNCGTCAYPRAKEPLRSYELRQIKLGAAGELPGSFWSLFTAGHEPKVRTACALMYALHAMVPSATTAEEAALRREIDIVFNLRHRERMDSEERDGLASVGGGGRFSADVEALISQVRLQNLAMWGAPAVTTPLTTVQSIQQFTGALFSGTPAPAPPQSIGQRIAEDGFYDPMRRIIERHVATGGCTKSTGEAALGALMRLRSTARPNGTVTFVDFEKAMCEQARLGKQRFVWTGEVPFLNLRSADSKVHLPIDLRVLLPCKALAFDRDGSVNRMTFRQNGVYPGADGIGSQHMVHQCEDFFVTAANVPSSPFAHAAAAALPAVAPAAASEPGPPTVALDDTRFDVAMVAVADTLTDRRVNSGSIKRLVEHPGFLDAVALLDRNIARVSHDRYEEPWLVNIHIPFYDATARRPFPKGMPVWLRDAFLQDPSLPKDLVTLHFDVRIYTPESLWQKRSPIPRSATIGPHTDANAVPISFDLNALQSRDTCSVHLSPGAMQSMVALFAKDVLRHVATLPKGQRKAAYVFHPNRACSAAFPGGEISTELADKLKPLIRCVVNQHPMMDRDYAGPETPAQRLDIAFTAAREEACRRAKSKLAAVEAQRESYAHSTDAGTADALDADDAAALSSGSDGCDSDPDAGMRTISESCDDVRDEDPHMQEAIRASLESAAPSAPAARQPTTFAQSRIFGASAPPPVPPRVRNTKPKQSPAVPLPKSSFFAPRG